jgi:hypothetical protein
VGQDAADRAKAMFSQYKGVWEDIASKMKDAKGYPVKSSFSLAIGGDQCKQAQTAKQQSGGADDRGGNASSGSSSGSASASGGSSGSTSPADLANQVGAKLGAFFHRKKDDSQAAANNQGTQSQAAAAPAAPAATGPSGTVPLMTVSSELVSVSTAPIPANAFDVPADFKKVERKGAT